MDEMDEKQEASTRIVEAMGTATLQPADSRQHHHLKIETEYFKAIERGEKKFELRKNDRNFKKYDMLYLEEVVNGVKTGRSLPPVEVRYVLKNCAKYGLRDGYCILNW